MLRKYKKSIAITAVIMASALTFILCLVALKNTKNSVSATGITVVLDAGHGGIDGGVVGVNTGVLESALNLKVVKKLETLFLSAGINVVLTRVDENGLYGVYNGDTFKRRDMENRKKVILGAKPNLVISVHMNKFSLSSRRGAQVFFDEKNIEGKKLSTSIQDSLNAMPEAVKKTSALKGDYFILSSHNFPSCIVECGFLSNPLDEALLITDEYQQKISYAVFKGAISYLSETTFYTEHL